jgi:hypothetical protein
MDTRVETSGRKVGRSRASRPSGYFGPLHDDLWVVVERAWAEPFAISSNFARQYAIATATAASLGWITNVSPDGHHLSRRWHVSFEGLSAFLNRHTLETSR